MPIDIDISGVPAEKRNRPTFLELQTQMQAAVNNPKWRAAFAAHEAGHKIYLERLGVTKFEFIGPHINYDAERDDFDGSPAAVKAEPVSLSAAGFNFDEWLLKLAQTKAAGAVFSRVLTEAPNHGEGSDWEEFKQACDSLNEAMPDRNINAEAVWGQAKDAIQRELRKPAFRKECWREAKEIEASVFGALGAEGVLRPVSR